jgi:hypothetical protein
MRGPPKKPEVVATGDLADYLELSGQVSLDFGDVFANLGVQLDITLKELGLDRALELRRDFAQNLGSAAAQGHGAAINEIELDLDTERRPWVADKSVRAQSGSLRVENGVDHLPTDCHQPLCFAAARLRFGDFNRFQGRYTFPAGHPRSPIVAWTSAKQRAIIWRDP